jgi:CubicO group peptidase (beta-lactamase class C family)
MGKIIKILLASLFLSICSYGQTEILLTIPEKVQAVEQNTGLIKFKIAGQPGQSLTERMHVHKVKGLSIAVIHNFKVEWAKGYGWADEEEQRKVTTGTCFEPGSISKSVNALGVLRQAQEGKLNLDTDINQYLHSWKFPYDSISAGRKITTAQLLSHTAGLGVHGFPGYFTGDSLPDIWSILDGKRPANTEAVRSIALPGMAFSYSGGGTMIAELMLMDLTGLPYDRYMKEQVLQPLGMTNSFFAQPPPKKMQHLLATGYNSEGKPMKGKYPILVEQAAGGLWTTATDLAKYVIEMQLSLQGKSNKVLSVEMTKRMLRPYIDSAIGLGVFIENRNGTRYFSHSAANQGFRGIYYGSFEDGNGVVVLINSDNEGLLNEVVNSVARVYNWRGMASAKDPVVKKVVTLPVDILRQYEGTYMQGTTVIKVIMKDHELWYCAGDKTWKMHFSTSTQFFNLESESEKKFYPDNQGKIKGFGRKADDKDLGNMEKVESVTLTLDKQERYTGTYIEPDGNKVKVNRSGDTLYIDPGNGPMKMNFITDQVFYLAEDFGATYRFEVNPDGSGASITGQKGQEQKIMKRLK